MDVTVTGQFFRAMPPSRSQTEAGKIAWIPILYMCQACPVRGKDCIAGVEMIICALSPYAPGLVLEQVVKAATTGDVELSSLLIDGLRLSIWLV